VFSASLLEFVLRCGFTFTAEGSFRSVRVEPGMKQSTGGVLWSPLTNYIYRPTVQNNSARTANIATIHEKKAEEQMWKEVVVDHIEHQASAEPEFPSSEDDEGTDSASCDELRQHVEMQRWRRCAEKMFSPALFLRGVTIQDFQLNITTKLFGTPKKITHFMVGRL